MLLKKENDRGMQQVLYTDSKINGAAFSVSLNSIFESEKLRNQWMYWYRGIAVDLMKHVLPVKKTIFYFLV